MSTKSTPANAGNLFLGTPNQTLVGTMSVKMLRNAYYTDGTSLQAGSTYVVTRAWGRLACDRAICVDVSGVYPSADSPLLNSAGWGARPVPTWVAAGDSLTQFNYEETVPSSTTHSIVRRQKYLVLAQNLLNQRFDITQNAGYAGDTTAGLLARLQNQVPGVGFGALAVPTNPPPVLPGVMPYGNGIVSVMIGVNDCYAQGGGVSVPVGRAGVAGTIIDNLDQIYSILLNQFSMVVAFTIGAVGSTVAGYTTTTGLAHLAVNAYIRNKCATTKGMVLVDAFKVTVDPTNAVPVAAKLGIFVDASPLTSGTNGLHYNNVGSKLIADEIVSVLTSIGALPNIDILPTQNNYEYGFDPSLEWIFPNPLLTGSQAASGATSGNGPTGGFTYTQTASLTQAVSVAAHPKGYGQQVTLDLVSSAATQNFQMLGTSVHARYVAGATYYACCEFSATGAAGVALTSAQNYIGTKLSVQFASGGNSFFEDTSVLTTVDLPFAESHSMVLRTPNFIPPTAGGAPTTFRMFLNGYFIGAGSAQIKTGRWGIRRVS